ncbi:glycosyltransferase family 61 protein [Sphingobium phenoxybenzoativorans]|uniref:glycosyltransferase family 61 protein n=1 Tax=Sphingobium phenoxybenzoativorans TaxID=1592790 RepID=UPI0009F4489B|nr:glycosyltransferase family 61 protein [Sphingobium phenoxybenzoativorans]
MPSLLAAPTLNRFRRAARKSRAILRPGFITGFISFEEYGRTHPGSWHFARLGYADFPPIPRHFGDQTVDMRALLQPAPDLGILQVEGGAVFGIEGWPFTSSGELLIDATWYNEESSKFINKYIRTQPRYMPGICLSLATDFGHNNYSHFVLDCLPRWELFQKCGIGIENIDYIYLPKPMDSACDHFLDVYGIPKEKCLFTRPEEFLVFDTLLCTSFPGSKRNYQSWTVEFLQSPFPTPTGDKRRIYVPRTGVRRIENEKDIIAYLRGFDFEVYNYEENPDEQSMFSEASVVVAPHGAGLTNLAFCAPGTKVFELFPSDQIRPNFYTLSHAARLSYSYMIGQSVGDRSPDSWGPSPFDFHIDADSFKSAVQILIGEAKLSY